MLWHKHVPIVRIYDPLGALFQRCLEQRDYLRGLGCQLVRQLFIIANQVREIYIAEVLPCEDVRAQLVAIDVRAVKLESEDEVSQFLRQFAARRAAWVVVGGKDGEGVGGPGVESHCCGRDK